MVCNCLMCIAEGDNSPHRRRSTARGMMMLSCQEAKRCLHMIPECVCDGDPTQMNDIVEQLEGLRAFTQKTFLHSRDWREGAEIVKAAIAEIKRLRALADMTKNRKTKA